MSANIRHTSESPKWGTNPKMIDIAHAVLCRALHQPQIYVDPFSEAEFNGPIDAIHYLDGSIGRDGFKDRWLVDAPESPRSDFVLAGMAGVAPKDFTIDLHLDGRGLEYANYLPTAFVNGPGSDDGENIKNAYAIVEKLWRNGWLPGGAFWVAFSLNQMQTLQDKSLDRCSPLYPRFVRCVPETRMPYTAHSSRPETRIDKHGKVVDNDDAPSHPSFFFLMPAYNEALAAEQTRLFVDMASELGEVF